MPKYLSLSLVFSVVVILAAYLVVSRKLPPAANKVQSGCFYQQVQCIRAPCDPILVCPTPPSTIICEPNKEYTQSAVDSQVCSCPPGLIQDIKKVEFGPCPQPGMQDCPQTTFVCRRESVPTPSPTCTPRPKCLDENPRCLMPETPDMCPKPTTYSSPPATYICPPAGWLDCMPGPGPAKPQCQKDYLAWIQSNCPDFQGVAY